MRDIDIDADNFRILFIFNELDFSTKINKSDKLINKKENLLGL